MTSEITPNQLAEWLDKDPQGVQLIDVREQWEWELGHIHTSIHMPLQSIPLQHTHLDSNKPTVTICHHGMRSLKALAYLKQVGFENIVSLKGGIDAWSQHIDNNISRY